RPPSPHLFPYTTLFRSAAQARVRVPGRGGAGDRIHRGDPVARLPADGRETAARVHGAPAHRQGAHGTARVRAPCGGGTGGRIERSEEHTSELQSRFDLV